MPRNPIAVAAFAISLVVAWPAVAQDDGDAGGERINQLIIYGDDPCPVSTGDEITVCARKAESERYRIPEPLRQSDDPANEAWNNRVLAYETVLDTGTLSCSPVGAGGWTGCTRQMIQQAYAEKQTDASVRFSELIAEERARRLSAIDEEAEETQVRVEEAEREYMERKKAAEAEAAAPVDESAPEAAEQNPAE